MQQRRCFSKEFLLLYTSPLVLPVCTAVKCLSPSPSFPTGKPSKDCPVKTEAQKASSRIIES